MYNNGHLSYSNNISKSGIEKVKNQTIKVCIRVRPMLEHEDSEFWVMDSVNNTIYTQNSLQGYKSNELSRGDALSALSGKDKQMKQALMDSVFAPQSFAFDRVYDSSSSSQLIYREICRDITKSVINGYNGTVFMYGQTTSGKTFTMLGSPNSPGLLPCALRDIFNMIHKESNPAAFNVFCSYIEIYNENIKDLLTESNNLKLVDDTKYGVTVVGAKRVKIKSFEDGISLKDYGEENRKYRETLINEYSSRSHTIFQIYLENDLSIFNQNDNNSEGVRYSCLNLVDLAGSERLTDYDSKTEAFSETGYINKSLFVLTNVVNKLAEGKNTHIPYRDSKLTRLLSQALGGNSLTSIICTVSTAAVNYYQTLSTLRFATRAKVVNTKAKVNEFMNDKAAIEYYKSEIKKLREELKNKNGSNMNSDYVFTPEYLKSNLVPIELINYAKITNESLSYELENYKEKYFSEKEKNDLMQSEITKLRSIQSSQNFQVSSEAFFRDNYNSLNKSNLENLNFSTNNSNKSNRVKPSTNHPNNNFNIHSMNPVGNFSNNLGNSNYNSTYLLENNFFKNTQNNEGVFIENLLNRIVSYVHDHKLFAQWCEEANKINGEYM